MRGRMGLLRGVGNTTMGMGMVNRSSHLGPWASFSSESAGGGRGRGRGRGQGFNFVAGNTNEDSNEEPGAGAGADGGHGHGRGRGNPSSSNPFLPSFNSFVAHDPISHPPEIGRGRGASLPQSLGDEPKRPIYLKKEDDAMGTSSEAEVVESVPRQPIGEKNLPENILNVLTGTGRGRPERKTEEKERVKEENRHLRPRPVGASAAPGGGRGGERVAKGGVAKPKLSREEAVKKAVSVLSRDDEGGKAERGRRRRGVGRKDDDDDDDDDDDEEENSDEENRLLGIGDDADGEKLANKLGPSMMAEISEALDDVLEERVSESEEYLEAFDTNLKVQPVHQSIAFLYLLINYGFVM